MADGHGWVNMRVPHEWTHPFVFQARDGRSWEKMLIGLPDGVNIDGREMGGWATCRAWAAAEIVPSRTTAR